MDAVDGIMCGANPHPRNTERKVTNMTEDKITAEIARKADIIAKSLKSGKDVEIRKTANGISVTEIKKTVVSR